MTAPAQAEQPVATVRVGSMDHGPFIFKETAYGADHLPTGEHSLFLRPSAWVDAGERWLPIESAPKDGTRILAYGMAFPELAEHGGEHWITADTKRPRVPFIRTISWVEGWYDKEIDNGDGTYRKERTQGYAYWRPDPHSFNPTHWMPLPPPPSARRGRG